MDLSAEDDMRMNVLLSGTIEAFRIDESSMTVFALSSIGVAKVKLNPNCRDELYLRRVREALSSHVLGSPGGYPVYLKRWTRMGQARDESLESLLLLGEPEAVVAVVNASGLTGELARRAWWASQVPENARCMLENNAVVQGDMGRILADYLVEYLPFEEEAGASIQSIRLVLQDNLVDEETKLRIWGRAKHKNAYYAGFLLAAPDDLPEPVAANRMWEHACSRLEDTIRSGSGWAAQFCRLLSGSGQTFLLTFEKALKKPSNQDVVVSLIESLRAYYGPLRIDSEERRDMGSITDDAESHVKGERHGEIHQILAVLPELHQEVKSMVALSMVDVPVVNEVFSRTDAIGSLMRRKLEPVTGPVFELVSGLRN